MTLRLLSHTALRCSSPRRSRYSISMPGGILVEVNGEQSVEEVFADVINAIDSLPDKPFVRI